MTPTKQPSREEWRAHLCKIGILPPLPKKKFDTRPVPVRWPIHRGTLF